MKLNRIQLADKLSLTPDTLERWIRQGRIPVIKTGDDYEFSTAILTKWANEHGLNYSAHKTITANEVSVKPDSLETALEAGGIIYDIPGNDTETVLAQAVPQIPNLPESSRSLLLNALLDRERMASTGIGNGVAIPHPRTPIPGLAAHSFITTCFLQQEIDFHAVDSQLVFVLFILYSPDIKQHLYLLSRLAFYVRDPKFIDFLRSHPSPDFFWASVAELEKR